MKMRDDFPIKNNGGQETMEWLFKYWKKKNCHTKILYSKKKKDSSK